MDEQPVRQAFRDQARWCESLGSPFTANLMRVLEPLIDRGTQLGEIVLDWPGVPDARGDALPLCLAGALQTLVLAGHAPALAAH
jgi:hypothetical protein